MTCGKLPLIAGSSCEEGWLVELVPLFLGSGRALCAELRVAGPPGFVSLRCPQHRMRLGNTCRGSKWERSCLKLKRKVPDSSFFCCASPPKSDGQVFTAADVASHQVFVFQAALQRWGTTRNISGELDFVTARRSPHVSLIC